jgi:hypothetical protein
MGWARTTSDRLHEFELASVGRLTVAGVLNLLDDPARVLGKTFVELLRFADDTSIDYDRRHEIGDPIHHAGRATPHARGSFDRLAGCQNQSPSRTSAKQAPRASRTVIRILRSLGLAEDTGRGVDVMQDTMAAELLDPPRFFDHGHEVIVELPIRSAVTSSERAWIHELGRRGDLRGIDRIALVHATRGEILTNKRIRQLLATDAHTARDVLQRLRDHGFLGQHGQRGGATYHLSGTLNPPAGLRLSPAELAEVVIGTRPDRPDRQQPRPSGDRSGPRRGACPSRPSRQPGKLVRTGQRRGAKYHAT